MFRYLSFRLGLVAWQCLVALLCVVALQLLVASPCVADERSPQQWIESLGGKARVDSSGQMISVDLRHCWLSDADMKRLGKIASLRSIRLAYTKVSDQGLEYLKPLGQVEELDLYFAESVGDAGLVPLKGWSKLKRLNLRGTKVTSTVFDHLIGMPELEQLDVGFSRVNDDNFERLSELPKLRQLAIGGNKMSGVALPLLKLIPSLRELDLGGQQRTDSGLWGVLVSDANCQQLAALAELESLDLTDTTLGDRGLLALSSLKNLRSLRLSRTKITSKGLGALKSLEHLRELDCAGVEGIDDGALPALTQMRQLQVLHLEGTKVKSAALANSPKPESLKRLIVQEWADAAPAWSGVEIVSIGQ